MQIGLTLATRMAMAINAACNDIVPLLKVYNAVDLTQEHELLQHFEALCGDSLVQDILHTKNCNLVEFPDDYYDTTDPSTLIDQMILDLGRRTCV